MQTLWLDFEKIARQCREEASSQDSNDSWTRAYGIVKEITKKISERKNCQKIGLSDLDDDSDYQFDMAEWMREYLDFLLNIKNNKGAEMICQDILWTFSWEIDSSDPFRSYYVKILMLEEKYENACKFCKGWCEMDPDSSSAIAAYIDVLTQCKNFDDAENLIKDYTKNMKCNMQNKKIYLAAADFYEKTGNEKKKAEYKEAVANYKADARRNLSFF